MISNEAFALPATSKVLSLGSEEWDMANLVGMIQPFVKPSACMKICLEWKKLVHEKN